ncbi:hypothetical protein CS022_01130 [Veronia nyctiphanis]|uniref:Porin n=1 Tax=Veronia nyctiphanis TaxID=1278244 RepID=A0A4Q0YVL0_9GAMM|nr:hypothetical protein [Veronia nyctiphanis]RXJ74845.1 hypothetical protein CS022_01130 [Veronia nyctiphanis]
MKKCNTYSIALACMWLSSQAHAILGADINVTVAVEHRQFLKEGSLGQKQAQTSLILSPEIYFENEDGDTSFTYVPYNRFDSLDKGRNVMDIREGLFRYYKGDYEIRVGIGQTFWGVMESFNPVDIVNQIDFGDSFDGSQKLGQPMLNLIFDSDYGHFDVLYLPAFRERSFATKEGRIAYPRLQENGASFESKFDEFHSDVAFRYSNTFGDSDIGLSAFHGTSRDPYFMVNRKLVTSRIPGLTISPVPGVEIFPFYSQMTQIGLDFQHVYDDWLFKLEAIHRLSEEDYSSAAIGFEYQLYGLDDYLGYWLQGHEWTLYGEYLYDSRGQRAFTYLQNDIFSGLRWTFNDLRSTEVNIGLTQDLEDMDSRTLRGEASMRLFDSWKIYLNGQMFFSESVKDALYLLRDDDFVEAGLEYRF